MKYIISSLLYFRLIAPGTISNFAILRSFDVSLVFVKIPNVGSDLLMPLIVKKVYNVVPNFIHTRSIK